MTVIKKKEKKKDKEKKRELGRLLASARRSCGETLTGAAEALGVHRSTINHWEKGTTAPPSIVVGKLLAHYQETLKKGFWGKDAKDNCDKAVLLSSELDDADPLSLCYEKWGKSIPEQL